MRRERRSASGERARLACWSRRRAETNFRLELVASRRSRLTRKVRERQRPSLTRGTRMLPRIASHPRLV
jgi:hypothetical protein